MTDNFNPKSEDKKTKKRRRTTSNKRTIIKVSYVVTAVVAVAIIAIFIFGFNFVYGIIKATDSFDISKLDSEEVSRIYDSEGNLIWKLNSTESGARENVTYQDLPQVLVDAVVAAEDSRFFEHNGFDLPRIVKAFIGNAVGSTYSGASTITQQIIKKSYYPEEQSTYQRKIGEVYLAVQADAEMSKEDILISYLNKIYFGNSLNSIGVQAASQYYFNKDVTELTLPEAALLAGTLNSPASYDPTVSLERATNRRNIILDLMYQHGYITEEERDCAKQIKVEDTLAKDHSETGEYQHYLAYIDVVIEEVKDTYGIDPTETSVDIYTYLNSDLQVYLDEIAHGDYFDFASEDMQLASSVQETTTGRVVGVIGGRDYVNGSNNYRLYNRAYSGVAQPGSSMKPITAYSAAFEFLDWSTAHTVDDSPYSTAGVSIYNWDRQNHTNVQVTSALSNSWNIPAIRTFEAVYSSIGSEAYKDYLKGFGLTIDDLYEDGDEADFGPMYAIGALAHGWTPMQIAGAYATMGNDGVYIEPHTINYVQIHSDDRTLNRDEEVQNAKTQACSAETAFMVRNVMLGYAGSGSYSYISVSGVEIAGKTGTSTYTNNTSKNTWMAGFSPDYSVATWLGYDSGSTVLPSSYKSLSHRTTGLILRYLHSDGTSVNSFSSAPDTLTYATIIRGFNDPYILAGDSSGDNVTSGYFKGTNLPQGLNSSIDVESLSSFTASANNDQTQISVSFGEYPDTSWTNDFNASDSSLKSIYGRILYTTVIKDSSGNELYRESSESSSYTINYTMTSDVVVTGQYTFANSSSAGSNIMSVTIKSNKAATVTLPDISSMIFVNGEQISSGGSVTMSGSSAYLYVSVTPSYNDNTVTVSVSGPGYSKQNTGADVDFTLTSAGTYTVTIVEQDKNKTDKQTKTYTFTLVEQATTEPETPDPNPEE